MPLITSHSCALENAVHTHYVQRIHSTLERIFITFSLYFTQSIARYAVFGLNCNGTYFSIHLCSSCPLQLRVQFQIEDRDSITVLLKLEKYDSIFNQQVSHWPWLLL